MPRPRVNLRQAMGEEAEPASDAAEAAETPAAEPPVDTPPAATDRDHQREVLRRRGEVARKNASARNAARKKLKDDVDRSIGKTQLPAVRELAFLERCEAQNLLTPTQKKALETLRAGTTFAQAQAESREPVRTEERASKPADDGRLAAAEKELSEARAALEEAKTAKEKREAREELAELRAELAELKRGQAQLNAAAAVLVERAKNKDKRRAAAAPKRSTSLTNLFEFTPQASGW